jgi:RNA polymerase sigma-70 factor, ECF subfamily
MFAILGTFLKRIAGPTPTTSIEVDASPPHESPVLTSTAVLAPPQVPTFEEVYETYFAFVWRSIMTRGVPHAAVDDVVQEVFMVVHRKLPSFEGRASLRTWLSIIVRRVARDHLRKRGNAPVGEPLGDDEISSLQGPAEAWERKVAVKILADVLARMTDIQREVFIMHEIEQMTGREIAEALDVNENTVHTRLRAARQLFESAVLHQRTGRQ